MPISAGTEKPYTSASTIPTRSPWAASAHARFTVTEDFPTPPLPLATAWTFVSDPGALNGMPRWPPAPQLLLEGVALRLRHDLQVDLDAGDAGNGGQGRLGVGRDGPAQRAARDGQEYHDPHAAAVGDLHGLHHAQLGDGAAEFRVDHGG